MNGLSVRARGLVKHFRVLRRQRTVLRALRALRDSSVLRKDLLALDDVSFDVAAGEKVALVGGERIGEDDAVAHPRRHLRAHVGRALDGSGTPSTLQPHDRARR